MSNMARKHRLELAQNIKKIIDGKGKVPTIGYQKLFTEVKEGSDIVSNLQLDEFLTHK